MRFLFTPHFSWFEVFFIAVAGAAWDAHDWLLGLAVLGIGALIAVAAEKHYNT